MVGACEVPVVCRCCFILRLADSTLALNSLTLLVPNSWAVCSQPCIDTERRPSLALIRDTISAEVRRVFQGIIAMLVVKEWSFICASKRRKSQKPYFLLSKGSS